VDPRIFVARDLPDDQLCRRHPDIHQRLNLESVTPELSAVGRRGRFSIQAEHRNMAAPEGVIPVAKIRIPGPAQEVYQGVEHPVTSPAQPGDVTAAPAVCEPRALPVVRTVQE